MMATPYTSISAGSPACRSFASHVATQRQPFIQIERRYTATWNDLILRVESGRDQWTASVRDHVTGALVYTAHRINADTAKAAALEFAGFAPMVQEREPVEQLTWIEHW
jgi:hypothetical protein